MYGEANIDEAKIDAMGVDTQGGPIGRTQGSFTKVFCTTESSVSNDTEGGPTGRVQGVQGVFTKVIASATASTTTTTTSAGSNVN